MRSKWWLILLAVFLVSSFGRVSISVASRKQQPPKATRTVKRTVERKEEMVDGYGKTPAAARDRALEHAQDRVEAMLQERFGDEGLKPVPQQLTAEYLLHYGVIQQQGDPKPAKGLGVDDGMLVARYKVELTPEYLQEVHRVAQEQRVQDRHLLLARLLGGLVVVFLVAAGYLRLEDMTRGYATQMLRLAAFGLVALTGVALWLTM